MSDAAPSKLIDPMPPIADVSLPWDHRVVDPVAEIASGRAAQGDTFAVTSGGMTYLFLFSPDGVRAFYELDESVASKGLADMRMLARKVPEEFFFTRRSIPHDMFTRELSSAYVEAVGEALAVELDSLGDSGELDVFGFTRRLSHRFGLASWGGPGAASGDRFEQLAELLDLLDPSEAFVSPEHSAEIAAADHAIERQTIDAVAGEYRAVLDDHDRAVSKNGVTVAGAQPDMFTAIVDRWSDADPEARLAGIAGDVALVHLGSLSNLPAAIGWTVINVASRPEVAEAIRNGDRALAEQVAIESTRLAQRSIMLREVHAPTSITVDGIEYALAPGATVATLLAITNTEAPGFEEFDPHRWRGRRLAPDHGLATLELVTSFGHGSHTCPAQPFSLRVMVDAVVGLVETFDLELIGDPPQFKVGQIGGVARSEQPCHLAYHRR